MAYLPSERLANLFGKSRVGFWIERMVGGRHALISKMPETIIKALVRGARCALLLFIVEVEERRILCTGLRVEDESEHPFSVITPDMLAGGLLPLREILSSECTTLHCVNELDHPVLSAWAALELSATRNALDKLKSLDLDSSSSTTEAPFELSEVERIATLALDLVQSHIYRSGHGEIDQRFLMAEAIGVELDLWTPIEVLEVGPVGLSGQFRIDDPEEGQKQEQSVHLLVNSIYPQSTYWSPKAKGGGSRRELTDVLAFDASSLCLIESKAAAVFARNLQQSAWRRTATITGHIEQSLGQLRGALKRVRMGEEIFDAAGDLIVVPNHNTSLAHAIVVLSEMYAFLDWRCIARLVVDLSEDDVRRALYHVIDVQELAYVVANSEDPDGFSNLMIQRWATVSTRGTAYVRAMFPNS